MFINILKDRLVSIERLEEDLNTDIQQIQKHKQRDKELFTNELIAYEEVMLEILDFLPKYQNKLTEYLVKEKYTMESYNAKFKSLDDRFFKLLIDLDKTKTSFQNLL